MPTPEPTMQPAPIAVTPPAGWYADPVTDGRTERWWNGSSWDGYSRARPAVSSLPPGVVDPAVRRRNSTARLSLLVGILALLVSSLQLFAPGQLFVSWVGVIAIVLGIRALLARSRRLATAFVPAVVGIVLGGLATLLTIVLLVVPSAPQDPGYSDQGSGVVAAAPGDALPTGVPTTVPSVDPDAAMPRMQLPDDALDSYSDLPIGSVTSVAAKCGVLQSSLTPFPIGTGQGEEAKRMQDFADLQLQVMTEQLLPQSSTPKQWPTAIDIDPGTKVVFLAAPACQPIGVLPKGDELRYAISPDKGQVALAIWNTEYRTGELWRSVDDTIYPL